MEHKFSNFETDFLLKKSLINGNLNNSCSNMLRSRNLEAENGYIKYREHYQGEMYFEWIKLFWTPG